MAVHNNVSTNISGGHRISPGGCHAGMWIVTYFPACADRCAIDVRSSATLAFHKLTILVPVMANSRLDLVFGGSTHQSRMMPSYPQREKSQWSCVAIASCGDHRHMPEFRVLLRKQTTSTARGQHRLVALHLRYGNPKPSGTLRKPSTLRGAQ